MEFLLSLMTGITMAEKMVAIRIMTLEGEQYGRSGVDGCSKSVSHSHIVLNNCAAFIVPGCPQVFHGYITIVRHGLP